MLPVTLFAALAAAYTPDACPFGVNAHQASDAVLGQVADAGVRWVRFDMNWWQFEPQPGVYDWAVADRFVDTAVAEGLEVFVTIAYTPTWNAPAGCNDASANEADWCHNAVPTEDAWTAFVTAAVGRYGDRVKAWGMWNEPNLGSFFQGTRDEYVDIILVPGSAAVHAACADCKVLGPELANLRGANWDADAGNCAFGECWFNGWEVSLAEILDDAGDAIDVISHHKYSDPADVFWSETLDGQWLIIQYMHGVREITDAHAPGKPVWITEMGWETTPGGEHSPDDAADELYAAYATLPEVQGGTWAGTDSGAWPELQRMFWYDAEDDPVIHPWGQYTWGLIDAGGVPKAPYYAYQDVIADLGGCDDADVSGGTGDDPGGSGGTGGSGGGTGGDPGGAGAGGDDPVDPSGSSAVAPGGCGCGHGTGGGAWLGVIALLGLRRRR